MNNWVACTECVGRGQKRHRVKKKVKLHYDRMLAEFEKGNAGSVPPVAPRGGFYPCEVCLGSGVIPTQNPPKADEENLPHIAIIGGGIGGVALAVACLHRSIPFTLFERDDSFDARAQGYGLTLQQASKAMKELGVSELNGGIISTMHIVHNPQGEVMGQWGLRKWRTENAEKTPRRNNIHISRQALRLQLLEQLGNSKAVKWGHQLIAVKTPENEQAQLTFNVHGETITTKADLIVGADGIRSTVRQQLLGENSTPLQYLGCIVILGICPLNALKDIESDLLDSETVFQTSNGNERIYMMPYSSTAIMWQLSFPMNEADAKALSKKGQKALKAEAQNRCPWHSPIPQILSATPQSAISGYPVYDRAILTPQQLAINEKITLIGDAAHPMSPFKGQGANQALLDALSLARTISLNCRPLSNWQSEGIRNSALNEFETEMLSRTASKVKASAEAAEFLHSEKALQKRNGPRGKNKKN